MEKVIVGIAEGKLAGCGQSLLSYALGSCVGVCLYDRSTKKAGLVHIILPGSSYSVERANPYKFADTGIRRLIQDMEDAGASRRFLTAKIAGGAKMFSTQSVQWEIGSKNVEAVKAMLQKERIPVIASDTGKNYGRTIQFYADDGRLEVRTVKHETIVL